MKTIILISVCLCLLATVINAEKIQNQQGKISKADHEEQKKPTDIQPAAKKEEDVLKTHTETKPEQTEPKTEQTETKPTGGTGRKHRNNHHGKNKKGAASKTETHAGRSRKVQQTKPNKHNGQRSHTNKHHGRKHGRGKQTQ